MKRTLLIFALIMALMAAGCGKKPSRTAQGYWDSASKLLQLENFTGAVELFESIYDYYPDDSLAVKALFAAADIYKNNLKEPDQAISIYEKIIKDYNDSEKTPNAMFMIGYIYANDKKDFEMAKTTYQRFIDQYPDHMLVPSAEWEIKFLGKSLDDIPHLQTDTGDGDSTEN